MSLPVGEKTIAAPVQSDAFKPGAGAQQGKPRTAEDLLAKYDTGAGFWSWSTAGDRRVDVAEILAHGGYAEFVMDLLSLSADEVHRAQNMVSREVGGEVTRLLATRSYFHGRDVQKMISGILAAFGEIRARHLGIAAPTAPSRSSDFASFLKKWDNGWPNSKPQNGAIDWEEIRRYSGKTAELLADMLELSPDEQRRALEMVAKGGDRGKEHLERDIDLFKRMSAAGEFDRLKAPAGSPLDPLFKRK